MTNEYYVIVDLNNLTYMKNGESVTLEEASRFETMESAKEDLKGYDRYFKGAIYRVTEYKNIELKKVE